MHEKLVKQLRNAEHCSGCPYDEDCNEFDSCLMDLLAADAIEDMNKRIARLEEELKQTATMKIENEYYILTKEVKGENVYLTSDYGFSNDIRDALKTRNEFTALCVRDSFEKEICLKRNYKLGSYISGLEVVLLKITYEW